MNARRAALLAVLASLAAGCTSGGGSAPEEALPAVPQARSSLARDTSPAVDPGDLASVVAGNDAFALALHRRLVEPGANMMTSPFSASTALAMLWPGARGDTATQLADALEFSLPQGRFHPAFDALDLALQAPASCDVTPVPFTLRLVNAVWAQDGFPFAPAYLDTLAVSYGAGVSLVDFIRAPETARQTINAAVERATENRIRDLLPQGQIDALTRLVLTNAVYFKARWATPFEPARTAPGTFRLEGGSAVQVPLMHGVVPARATTQPGYDAVELPYRCSGFAMTVIAPAAGTFDAFEAALDAAGLASVDAALSPASVNLALPKFGFEWARSLKPTLQAMGMTDAFDAARSDLGGITAGPDRLFVTEVLQKTFVAVDENGTEAAAATAVIGGVTSGPPPPITVTIDRPFLFLIRHRTTGQILFLGRVVDPR